MIIYIYTHTHLSFIRYSTMFYLSLSFFARFFGNHAPGAEGRTQQPSMQLCTIPQAGPGQKGSLKMGDTQKMVGL